MFLAYLDGIAGSNDWQRLLEQGIAYADANGFTWDVIDGRYMLARLLQRTGQIERARIEYERARALAIAAGNRLLADDCDAALRELSPTSDAPGSSAAS